MATKAQKEAAAKKKAAAEAAKLGGGKEVEIVITEAYLAEHPDLAKQGFEVGQKIVVPASEAPKGVKVSKEEEAPERSEEDESTMQSDIMFETLSDGKKRAIWYVKSLGDGKFRLYNEVGQAVSPITTEPLQINKAAARANALNAAKLR